MAKKRKPSKPTGESGPVFMSAGPQGAAAQFQQLAFPTAKEEIAALVVHGFVKAAESILPFRVESYGLNKQDDFDFDVNTTAGPKSLELVEVAFLEKAGGSYTNVPSSYKPYEFAQAILGVILKKSRHYGGRPPAGLHLLLYITHWAFIPSMSTLALLQHWTATRTHGFEGIHWYAPITRDDGIAFPVFPVAVPAKFDPEAFRGAVVQNLDPKAWTPGGA